MVFCSKITSPLDDTMLQIVPCSSSGGISALAHDYNCDFSADNFDLSLLSDGEVPLSASNNNVQNLLSLYYDQVNSPPTMFLEDSQFLPPKTASSGGAVGFADKSTTEAILSDHCQDWESAEASLLFRDELKQKSTRTPHSHPNQQSQLHFKPNNSGNDRIIIDDGLLNESFQQKNAIAAAYWQISEDIRRVPSSVFFSGSSGSSSSSISSPSSCSSDSGCPSPDFQHQFAINSPDCGSAGTIVSSAEHVKPEVTLDLRHMLSDVTFTEDACNRSKYTISSIEDDDLSKANENAAKNNQNDYKILREVLKDTSFQEKYNLKPYDIEGLGTIFQTDAANGGRANNISIKEEASDAKNAEDSCYSEENDYNMDEDNSDGADSDDTGDNKKSDQVTDMNLETVLSQAIEQLIQDVEKTSLALAINKDPKMWSTKDVRTWLLWNVRQYNIPVPAIFFNMDGSSLVTISEQEFQRKFPQGGVILYSQLEIWKAASIEDSHLNVNDFLCGNVKQEDSFNNGNTVDITDDEDDEDVDMEQPVVQGKSGKTVNNGETTTDGHNNGGYNSHIHLWQFLKELLANPEVHGSCIRWLDVNAGVFKIENSVRVARLWGKRKNRPAMNYDKLSRSIRQYYKKGIMKKTERSQRLVYQFCPPYNII